MRRILLALSLLCLAMSAGASARVAEATIKTPYPERVEVRQIISSEVERQRMNEWFRKFDHVLTGFYADSSARLVVNLETVDKPKGDYSVFLVIGTPVREGDVRKAYKLREGRNEIVAEKQGMIYLRYISNEYDPVGRAVVTFDRKGGHRRAPHYIKGVTSHDEFAAMLKEYPTRDVMFSTDKAVVVVGRKWAEKYSVNEDKEQWLARIDRILDIEDDISGLDNDDPDPLHHRVAPGIRYLFTEARVLAGAAMFATTWATGYFNDFAMQRLLTDSMLANNNWGLSHELGHQHQQMAYYLPAFQENTVNFYSLAVQRNFYDGFTRAPEQHWIRLRERYFAKPVEQRSFFANDADFVQATGEVNASRLMMFEQLYFLFGEDYMRQLHRLTRSDVAKGTNEQDRALYLAMQICRATGYDLRGYFAQWGYLNGLSAESRAKFDKYVTDRNLPLPPHDGELHLVTGTSQKQLPYLPIKMIGERI